MSIFLSLTLLFCALDLTGIPIRADNPEFVSGEEITLNASLSGMEVDYDIAQDILETLDAIKEQSNVFEADGDCHFVFFLDASKLACAGMVTC